MAARRKDGEEGNKEVLSEEKKERSVDGEEGFEEATREAASVAAGIRRKRELPTRQIVVDVPEVVDDFLRNFLRRAGLTRTCATFEAEWNSRAHRLRRQTAMSATTEAGWSFIPDAVTHGQLLRRELDAVRRETEVLRQEALAAGEEVVRTRKERDFHRLQCRQVAEDKNRLIANLNRLKKHVQSYEPALKELNDKYQAALRRKMLLSLENDRVRNTLVSRADQGETTVKNKGSSTVKSSAKSPIKRHPDDSEFPNISRQVNPQVKPEKCKTPSSFSLSCSIGAHKLSVSCISLHPRKLLLASASDDRSWRLWAMPANGGKVRERERGQDINSL